MKRFSDKTVVVTGGGGGIGGASCHRFAREGARVAVLDVNLESARATAASIQAESGLAQAWLCDISDRASVDEALAHIIREYGDIDVLVNNAGWDVFKPFTKTVSTTPVPAMEFWDVVPFWVMKKGRTLCAPVGPV